jgi:hypothetical protein
METKTKTVLKRNSTPDVSAGQVAQDISEDGVEQHNAARKLHHKAFTRAMKSYATSPNHNQAMKDLTTHAKTMKDLEKKHGLKLNQFGGAYKVKESVDLNEVKTQSMADKPDHLFKVKPNYWGSKETLEKGRADQKIKDAKHSEQMKKDKKNKTGMFAQEASCGMNPNVKEYNDKEKKMVKEDREVSMAVSQLKTMCEYGTDLIKNLEAKGPDYNIEAWVQSKITKAADYMNSVGHYMENEAKVSSEHSPEAKNEENELDEALGNHMGLMSHANKNGGVDKKDMHTAANHIKVGNMSQLKTHLSKMDTDPRDKVLDYVHKKHYKNLGYSIREDVYDPFTKKMVKRKPMKQQMGGPALNTNRPKDDTPAPIKIKYKDQPKKMDYSNYKEDAPANASGGGAIAGVGVGPEGEPGVMLPRKKRKKDAVMGFAAFNRKSPV